MADTQRDLLDEDGENRALRSFLMQYGLPGLTVGAMRDHMKRSGWGDEYWPFFVSASNRDTHLTKGGAQVWIRHLLAMEVASRPAEVDDGQLRNVAQFLLDRYDELRNKKGAPSTAEFELLRLALAPSHTTNKENG